MSNNRLLICFVALLLLSEVEGRREYKKQYYYSGRRHAKQVHRYVRTPLDCEAHEHFQRCGNEAHCDLRCDNLFTPPSCQTNYDNPKCYFPRCICEPGFVRHHEKCIRIQACKKHYLRNYDEQF
ncbi:TIL domain-containing protein [Aphelenchoides besseyi]|nr:TIL domain-containing protein [Aphelenchoides besseyi]